MGFLLVMSAWVPRAEASNYPPDYPMCYEREIAEVGPFKLIKETLNPYARAFRLTVAYNGELKNSADVGFWIRLNGQEITVRAEQGRYNDVFVELHSSLHNCTMAGSNGWQCESPDAFEKRIFYYAADQNGRENDWDVEVAAVAKGRWDSNRGKNYQARFGANRDCR